MEVREEERVKGREKGIVDKKKIIHLLRKVKRQYRVKGPIGKTN